MITMVTSDVFRGPRPEPTDYADIRAKFKTVLSLEGLEEDAKETVELAPVPITSLPIDFWQIYVTGITQNYLNRIIYTIMTAPKPVLVHCQHGEDRTGLAIAAYRVTEQNWTKDEAMKEA